MQMSPLLLSVEQALTRLQTPPRPAHWGALIWAAKCFDMSTYVASLPHQHFCAANWGFCVQHRLIKGILGLIHFNSNGRNGILGLILAELASFIAL